MSSYVITAPEALAAASQDLTWIGSTLRAANASAGSTTTVLAAAGDEVPAAIASLFGGLGQEYQALSARCFMGRVRVAVWQLRRHCWREIAAK